MKEVLKEGTDGLNDYRVIKITYDNVTHPVDYCKVIIQIKLFFLWMDIKTIYYEEDSEFTEQEAIELFDKIVNPYRYG